MALVDVVVWTEKNEIGISSEYNLTLDNFADYKTKVLSRKHPNNDNAILLTKNDFEDKSTGESCVKELAQFLLYN